MSNLLDKTPLDPYRITVKGGRKKFKKKYETESNIFSQEYHNNLKPISKGKLYNINQNVIFNEIGYAGKNASSIAKYKFFEEFYRNKVTKLEIVGQAKVKSNVVTREFTSSIK